jgi:hypothetical protein
MVKYEAEFTVSAQYYGSVCGMVLGYFGGLSGVK